MKSQLNLRKALITALFVIIGAATFAQTGKISGKVSDKKTGETLIGVTVKIKGTTKGASTDVEGNYAITGLNDGRYTLTFQYVGYAGKEVSDITVAGSKNTQFNVILDEAGENLSEVLIQGSFKKESVNSLYSAQKNSVSISSGISADLIKRSPDRNTSDVLKRVSGASIQDNKFVVIRGLNDRYNSALINNAILPSSEPDRKAFSFDIFPSNLIDRIIINKTASPDLPGDFAGGVVQIFTKDVPDDTFLEVSVGQGFNTNGKFGDFTSSINSKNKWLGASAGARELPTGFPATRQIYAGMSDDQKAVASRLLPNNYGESTSKIIPAQNHQLTFGYRKDLKNDAVFGSLISLTYRSAQNLYSVKRDDYDNPETRINPVKSFNDEQNRFNVTWGGIANFSYKKGNNKISFKNSYNRVLDELYYNRTGYSISSTQDINFRSSDLTQKSFYNTQLEGDHVINEKKWKLNWNANYANIGSSRPDLRTIAYSRTLNTTDQFLIVDRDTRRFFSKLTDDNYGASVNLTVPFSFSKESSTFKAGLLGLQKVRNFDARIFNYQSNSADNSLRALRFDQIFNDENIRPGGFLLNDFTSNQDSYEAQSTLGAGYFMFDNKLSEKIRLVWGSRFEYYYQNLDGLDASAQAIDATQNYFDILPSFNLTYTVSEQSNFRLSGSKTVSRAEFRELAPFSFYDYQTNASINGFDGLKRGENYNGDIRFETYPSAGEAITVSAFYKRFVNPIELYSDPSTSADLRRFNYGNADAATIYGLEVDFRKTLSFIGQQEWLKNFTVFANATYLKSKVELGAKGSNRDRPLQGQSPYLINAGLQYFSPASGFTFSALYNRIGERISAVGLGDDIYPDWYENSRDIMDLQLSKKLFKSKAELKLNVSDVFNQSIITYQNLDGKGAYNKEADRDIFVFKPGSSFSLSFSYRFGK